MPDDASEVEFFGMRIKVRDPKLAALLNSDLSENVVVIGRRTRDLFSVEIEHADEAVEGQSADDARQPTGEPRYEPPTAADGPPEAAPEPHDDPPFSV